LGLLTTFKPPASRVRSDFLDNFALYCNRI